ncbi:MAG: response regulator transcription factor [Catenibacillus sp.]
MITILIVEDDAAIRLLTKTKLAGKYRILEADNGENGLDVLDHHHVDLIIADIMMPKMNGYDFVTILRESGMMTPVIMLTAMSSFAHKKKGYSSGIDDYMTKPINYEELEWHIEALLRRAKISNENKIIIGNLNLNRQSMSVKYNETEVPVTTKEFELLYKFLSYPDVVFTKQQLMDEIWGYDTDTDYNTIKTYISRLRHKFSKCNEFSLVSLRGLGYKATIHKEDI